MHLISLVMVMNFGSIRSKTAILFIPLIVIPLLVVGIIGAFYFQDVIKHNIWDDNMGQAKAVSALTASYVNLSENYLGSIADRPLVIKAVEERNQSFLNETTVYTAVQSFAFDSAFITDDSGVVISYGTTYPGYSNRSYPGILGENLFDRPYVGPVLNESRPVAKATRNDIDDSSTIYVGVPIRDNNTTIGAIIGTYDMGNYTRTVIGTAATSDRYIYLVNRSGNVIVHYNQSYMNTMADFTSVPAVRDVIRGDSGVAEQYNPIEKDDRLVAYYPVNSTGWGVVVAVPTSVVYRPVTNVLWVVSAVTLALAAIALALAYLFSKSLTDPILGLYNAARAITNHREYKQYLPVKRNDEIGQVAVCMDQMAQRINEDREKITAERDRAEEERKRSELYLDIMGHDINNMNQSTLGNLELIRDDASLTADERQSIEAAIASALGSAALINNVRTLQQVSEEKPGAEVVDINDKILECIREVPRPGDKKVTINYTPRQGMVSKCGHLVKEVFCNLINNSVKHSGQEVTIDIVAGEAVVGGRKCYTVAISDNGPGIHDEVKPKLFNRFQRGDTKAHGKGLGLYIVRSILEKCDGSVKVEDRVPGDYTKGAKFTVTIPATEG